MPESIDELAPEQLTAVVPGLVVVDPAAFEARPIELLRLVLAPMSRAEPQPGDTYAGHALRELPLDVALTIARARDAGERNVRLRFWTLGAAALAASVPRFERVPGTQFDEYEAGTLEDVVVLAVDDDDGRVYWSWQWPEGHRLRRYVSNGRDVPEDSQSFADAVLWQYQAVVQSVRFAVARLRADDGPALTVAPGASDDATLDAVLDTCSRLYDFVDALCRLPRWLCVGSLSSMFRALFADTDTGALLAFLDAGAACAERDAEKPNAKDRRYPFNLLRPWRVARAFAALDDEARAPAFAAVAARWERLLERRCAELPAEKRDGDIWRTWPPPWERE